MPMQSNFSLHIIGLMVFSMSVIVAGDAAAKALTAAGFNQFFVAWIRFALAGVLLLPFSGLKRTELSYFLNWRIILRACLIAAAISSILTALKTEPIANAFGGFFIGPIISYFLSALVLRERISLARTALLATSFVGVLCVVKPGFGMSSGMAFAVLAGCFHGSFLVMTRWLANSFRPRFLLISQLLIGAVILSPFSLSGAPALTPKLTLLVLLSTFGSAIGNLILVHVNRTTPAGLVAPLIYSQLLAATVIGWLVFSDWPDYLAMLGLLIIMCAGVSSFWVAGREKQRLTASHRAVRQDQ